MVTRNNASPVLAPQLKSRLITWTGLLNGDVGDPVDMQGYFIASVEWEGTPGVGFAGQTQITNKPTVALSAVYGGTPTQWSSVAGLAASASTHVVPNAIIPYAAQVRPNVTGGDGTTNMTCRILLMFY
jgi:hypothetical protein